MAELRKMTMGEVSEVADVPKETLRSRIKGGVGEQRTTYGWARFDLPSTIHLAIHAEMLRRTGLNEIAVQAANFVAEGLTNFCNHPPFVIRRKGQLANAFLIFRRHDSGYWHMLWADGAEQAARYASGYIKETEVLEAAGFYFLNVGTLTDWALDRVFDLQGIDGNEAKVPQ